MALTQLKIAPTGMRLHEWIALERGYFQDQGIEPVIRWDVVRGIQSSWRDKQYRERPQDDPFLGKSEPLDVINHCAWAIAVGMRAGSHFNVPYRLEPYLPLERIKTVNVGGFGARLQALLDGEVDAASLLDPQISMADELGLRQIIRNTFKTLWVVPADADTATLDAYFRVLERADADLESDPAACLPLWKYSIPAEFADRPWDFSRFDVGERFFHRPLPREEFDQLLSEAERWGLADQMQSKRFEELVLQTV